MTVAREIELGMTRNDLLGTDFRRAEKIYANQGMHRAARAFVASHPRAIQYLEQAPIMALMVSPMEKAGRLHAFIQLRTVGPCERGVPLKTMMALFQVPLPLRRLSGYACEPRLDDVARSLCKLDPVVLGRIIPEKPGQQRTWMRRLGEFMDRHRQRGFLHAVPFEWAAVALSGALAKKQAVPGGEAADMADFAIASHAGDDLLNPAWGWKRAVEEMERWHTTQTVARSLAGSPVKPDTVVDFYPHPDAIEVLGFEFAALRTPLAIAEEGKAMRHCVASYIPDVISGRCSIISIRKGGQRVATLEVQGGRTRQLQGPCNTGVSHLVHFAVSAYIGMKLWDQPKGARPQ